MNQAKKSAYFHTHTHTRKGEPFISFIMINFFLCFLKVKSCKKTVLNSMNVINFGVWKSAFSSFKTNEILKEWFILNHVLSCWLYSIIFCNYKNAWEKCVLNQIDFFSGSLVYSNVVHSMRKFESFKPALPEMVFQQKTL